MTVVLDAPEVGTLLRTWRERRRFSQQELSNRSLVSTRHLSRVETGKAQPTSDMVLHLADHLEVPLREQNRLLLAAGYAPHYRHHDLDDQSLAVVMDGLRHLLEAHLPYPALLLGHLLGHRGRERLRGPVAGGLQCRVAGATGERPTRVPPP